MFRKICGISFLAVCSLAFMAGCVVDGSESGINATVESQTETFIDLDSKKEGALGLIFGMPQIDDRLDYNGGDREDWRYIIVAEQGNMSITINVDAPADIDGGWKIIDSEGRTLHHQSFSKSQGYYEFPTFPVKRGVYYFQTFATAGKSIYSIATSFQPQMAPPPPPEPEEEFEEEVEEERPKKARKPRKTQSDDDKPAKPAKKPAASGNKIKGFISIITLKSDGSAEVTIRDIGKNKGIETGAIGTIEGTSIKLEMTQCFATSCRTIVPESANPKGLKKGANVIFAVD
ncbi:MAG: hypothetical protein J6S69_07870 [Proteobacteria bacterium]|nr:hypothetical protein [Pseudomonadota bacterium]